MVLEETGNKPLEEVTQTVVTISAPTEHAFRECLLRIIDKYRAPRTVYSTWGSDERAKEIFARVGQCMGWLVLTFPTKPLSYFTFRFLFRVRYWKVSDEINT